MKRLYLSPPHVDERERDLLLEAFESNFIAPTGPHLSRFEEKFCELTGFSHACAVVSGTAAIHLALRSVGVEAGDVVIGSTLTFIGSVSPVVFLGAELVLIDSDPVSWNMDASILAEAVRTLTHEGRKIAAILPTDLYGQSCDLENILETASDYAIAVITDSAEALGAEYGGRSVGRGATGAAFSFNGNKILTTSGGGMFASDDESLVQRARYLATQAREPVPHFEHLEVGYNYRLSNLLAAVGIGQLEKLSGRVARKREIFDKYADLFRGIRGISMMPEPNYGTGNRWLTVVLVDEGEFGATPEEIRLHLEASNIESRPLWKPMHLQTAFRGVRCFGGPISEGLFKRGLCLPSGTQMNDQDIERVVGLILECKN